MEAKQLLDEDAVQAELNEALSAGRLVPLNYDVFGFVESAESADGSFGVSVQRIPVRYVNPHACVTSYLFLVDGAVVFRRRHYTTDVAGHCRSRERQLRWLALKLRKAKNGTTGKN